VIWIAVLGGSLGCYALKLAGVSVPERVLESALLRRVAAALPIALLAALVVTQTLATGRHLHVDARVAGVAVAVLAVLRRAPFLVVVGLAALTAALVRLFS
jgi:branched-subunit amino acid transport protein